MSINDKLDVQETIFCFQELDRISETEHPAFTEWLENKKRLAAKARKHQPITGKNSNVSNFLARYPHQLANICDLQSLDVASVQQLISKLEGNLKSFNKWIECKDKEAMEKKRRDVIMSHLNKKQALRKAKEERNFEREAEERVALVEKRLNEWQMTKKTADLEKKQAEFNKHEEELRKVEANLMQENREERNQRPKV